MDEENKNTKELATIREPALKRNGDNLTSYIAQIQKFPMLSAKEEYEYASRFKKNGDKEAAKILIQSHLRLVVKIALKFKNYGLPVSDLISEGNIGLIQAVKKFDPDKGFRFSTYAMWWIKALIQEQVLKSWSMVKIGTTAAQKKLFFNLYKIKKRLGYTNEGFENSSLSDKQIARISHDLNVSEREVKEMDSRLSSSDFSLNSKFSSDEDSSEIGEIIVDDDDDQEKIVIDKQEKSHKETLLKDAFAVLNERERDILIKRQMSEVSSTLDELSKTHKISRERIRQIEEVALNKIKKEVARLKGEE